MKPQYEPKTFEQRLGYLIEECGEVLAAAGKLLRWGAGSINPELRVGDPLYGETNLQWLEREVADLQGAIDRYVGAAAPGSGEKCDHCAECQSATCKHRCGSGEGRELREALEKLHWRNTGQIDVCVHCRHTWPCPTIRALRQGDAEKVGVDPAKGRDWTVWSCAWCHEEIKTPADARDHVCQGDAEGPARIVLHSTPEHCAMGAPKCECGGGMRRANHLVCDGCGACYCPECRKPVGADGYCDPCAERACQGDAEERKR